PWERGRVANRQCSCDHDRSRTGRRLHRVSHVRVFARVSSMPDGAMPVWETARAAVVDDDRDGVIVVCGHQVQPAVAIQVTGGEIVHRAAGIDRQSAIELSGAASAKEINSRGVKVASDEIHETITIKVASKKLRWEGDSPGLHQLAAIPEASVRFAEADENPLERVGVC